MGTQRVDFEQTGADTGERNDVDSVQPVAVGERVWPTVTNRPTENLRGRTEFVRSALEDQMYLSDVGNKYLLHGGQVQGMGTSYMGGAEGYVTDWTPEALGSGPPWTHPAAPYRGTFVLGSNLVIESVLSVGQDAPHVQAFYVENAAPPRNYTIYLNSLYQAAEGGDTIVVNWTYNPGAGFLNVTVTGDPVHIINIEVSGDGSVTLNQVEAAINAVAGGLVNITNAGDSGTTIDIADIAPTAGAYPFVRESQREVHILQPATLASFFAHNDPVNDPYTFYYQLKDGDTLAVYFPSMVNPLAFFGAHGDPLIVGGRRQATLTNAAIPLSTATQIEVTDLFNTSVEPEKIAQSIPICKRIGDDLVFLDGTVISGILNHLAATYPPGGVHFGEHGYTLNRIVGAASTVIVDPAPPPEWYGGVFLTGLPSTINDTFWNVVNDLSSITEGASGIHKVGIAPSAAGAGDSVYNWTWLADSVWTILGAARDVVNDKASLAQNEEVTGAWDFSKRITVQSEVGSGDHAIYGLGDGDGAGGKFEGGAAGGAVYMVPQADPTTGLAEGVEWYDSAADAQAVVYLDAKKHPKIPTWVRVVYAAGVQTFLAGNNIDNVSIQHYPTPVDPIFACRVVFLRPFVATMSNAIAWSVSADFGSGPSSQPVFPFLLSTVTDTEVWFGIADVAGAPYTLDGSASLAGWDFSMIVQGHFI